MFRFFSKFEIGLWLGSCGMITFIFLCNAHRDILTVIASLLGATMLIFLAKGHPTGQIMTIVFALIYAVISYRLAYYGEMITYLGMTAPTAAVAAYEWTKNPYQKGKAEVKVAPLNAIKVIGLIGLTIVVTVIFYFILRYLNTANLVISTISVATSFLASSLTVLRSHFYAIAYGANDVVLIGLWTMASIADIKYLPMVLCFCVFLVNDIYGFVNWTKMMQRQGMQKVSIQEM